MNQPISSRPHVIPVRANPQKKHTNMGVEGPCIKQEQAPYQRGGRGGRGGGGKGSVIHTNGEAGVISAREMPTVATRVACHGVEGRGSLKPP